MIEDFCQDNGIPFPQPADLSLEYFWAKPGSRRNVAILLPENGLIPGKYFVFAPFSAKREAKNWRSCDWLKLAGWIHEQYGYEIVIIGGKDEAGAAENLIGAEAERPIHNWCGRLTLDESYVLLEQAAGFAGLDSGPAFLASAAGIPAVVLYGPGDIVRWHPPQITAPRINIHCPQSCSPCRYKVCPHHSLCMNAISLTEVKTAVGQCLENITVNNIRKQ